MFTNEEINKLPLWAQRKANVLMANLEAANKKLAEISGEAETNVQVDFYSAPILLPINSPIKFTLADGYIRCKIDNDELEIHSQCFDKTFVIQPKVSNSIICKFV